MPDPGAYNLARLPFSLKDVWYFLFFGLGGHIARWRAAKDDFGWFMWFTLGALDKDSEVFGGLPVS